MKDKTCSVSLLEPPQPCTKKAKALKEYKFKEKKKRRKLRPVSDKRTEVYVVAKPRIPFGATVYYSPRPNSDDPQIVLCELSIDGKHAGRWLLRAGERREAASVSRFSDEQDENTDGPSLRCFGTVEVIFWRGIDLLIAK